MNSIICFCLFPCACPGGLVDHLRGFHPAWTGYRAGGRPRSGAHLCRPQGSVVSIRPKPFLSRPHQNSLLGSVVLSCQLLRGAGGGTQNSSFVNCFENHFILQSLTRGVKIVLIFSPQYPFIWSMIDAIFLKNHKFPVYFSAPAAVFSPISREQTSTRTGRTTLM